MFVWFHYEFVAIHRNCSSYIFVAWSAVFGTFWSETLCLMFDDWKLKAIIVWVTMKSSALRTQNRSNFWTILVWISRQFLPIVSDTEGTYGFDIYSISRILPTHTPTQNTPDSIRNFCFFQHQTHSSRVLWHFCLIENEIQKERTAHSSISHSQIDRYNNERKMKRKEKKKNYKLHVRNGFFTANGFFFGRKEERMAFFPPLNFIIASHDVQCSMFMNWTHFFSAATKRKYSIMKRAQWTFYA